MLSIIHNPARTTFVTLTFQVVHLMSNDIISRYITSMAVMVACDKMKCVYLAIDMSTYMRSLVKKLFLET